ncbi:CBS domain-containing protein [Micromonospora sp. LOL_015]|uniref:CBS domain-containing protein n=1 Tax=Micromonospora sp. LOL_015 TaxID=3345416 RepID=UPI003A842E33
MAEIRNLWTQISSPPSALSVLDHREVCQVHPEDLIGVALDHVRRFNYSQLPVYDQSGYIGILTTNAIGRWLADSFVRNTGLAEEQTVREMMQFAEEHDRAAQVPRTITAAEAIDRLSRRPDVDQHVTVLIVTQGGRTAERPLALIVPYDLPALTAAIAIT